MVSQKTDLMIISIPCINHFCFNGKLSFEILNFFHTSLYFLISPLFTSTKFGGRYLLLLLSSIYRFISLELINKKAWHDLVFHVQYSKRMSWKYDFIIYFYFFSIKIFNIDHAVKIIILTTFDIIFFYLIYYNVSF